MQEIQTLEEICRQYFGSSFELCGNNEYRKICVGIQRNQIEAGKLKVLREIKDVINQPFEPFSEDPKTYSGSTPDNDCSD